MLYSNHLIHIQELQFQWQFSSWAGGFHHWLKVPPTYPLNPINPDNAWTLRITAAAGTELAGPYSYSTVSFPHVERFLPIQKQFTTHRAVFLHAAWLDQTFVHCPIFPTAASRRSLVRVSVPVWGIILSDPLSIVVLVSRYLTNKLIDRMPIYNHRSFKILHHAMSKYYRVLIRISSGYPPVIGRLHTCYAPVRRFPLSAST
jgi:hypothetical protein